ncbi:hypothetical protein ALI144C_02530 [Actinosynnema sp. ALI-1.44]|uniref:hypothetical protein n=1 Tax=Actinosynnema sp. ALI-1.44 TaxID=1933779 RepID=UPI00097C932B|nr:hypothetical protein [Actinosynnema sp. ALI-1.44]ONI90578.1 hypothetical protein ALI144C_02530 [Actinosynnema sp. ALI-1.44]
MARIEAATRVLRAWDYQCGGGACYDAVVTYVTWAQRLLGAATTEPVGDRLRTSVADLHCLAGWTAFDIDRVDQARRHFDDAARLAQFARNDALVAGIRYRRGRVHLHHNALDAARVDFQLGQHAAQACASALPAAILHANQAWVAAKMGLADDALASLGKGLDDFTRSDPADAPGWAAFFDINDLLAMSGVIYADLARSVDPFYARAAIPALTNAADGYSQMARSRSFSLVALAASHLIEHDADRAAAVGAEAIAVALTVRSSRVRDRLLSLKNMADQHRDNADARELSERIAVFAAVSPAHSRVASQRSR